MSMFKYCWIFMAFKTEDNYPTKPFFTKVFLDHTKMKIFSAHHSAKYKKKYPNYCSDYAKHCYKVILK